MWLKNEGAIEVIAKFNGKEVLFASGKTINISTMFPEYQVKQAADHFMVKYGLKSVQEPVAPAAPEISAAEPQESAEEAKPEKKDKKEGKKRG